METEKSVVEMSREAVKKLVASGCGDAALLYLARRIDPDVCAQTAGLQRLGFTQERAAGALAALRKMGLDEVGGIAETPESEAPEMDKESISVSDIAQEIESNGDFAHLVAETERRLGSKLSTAALVILMNIYSNLGLPTEVLYLLLTYCVEDAQRYYGTGRKPTIRQLEKEAYHWARLELDTPEKAAKYIQYRKDALSKAGSAAEVLGIGARRLSRSEENYITRWIEWGFGPDEIEAAYDKTVLKTGELSWKYLNTILQNWHEKNLHTLEEIRLGDRRPVQGRSEVDRYELEAIEWAKKYNRRKASGEEVQG